MNVLFDFFDKRIIVSEGVKSFFDEIREKVDEKGIMDDVNQSRLELPSLILSQKNVDNANFHK